MAVDNVNNSNAQQIREDQNRTRTNTKDPVSTSQASRAMSRQTKESKSLFDMVLENAAQPSTPQQSNESSKFSESFNSQVRETRPRDEDRGNKGDKSEDKKTSRSSDDKKEGSSSLDGGGLKGVRIVGKQDSGERQSSGGGGGSGTKGDGGSSGQFGKRQLTKEMGAAPVNAGQAQGIGASDRLFASRVSETRAMTQIPKELLDQIVKQITILQGKVEGSKELQIDFSEKTGFRGLSVKVSRGEEGVNVLFLASDPQVKRLFERESDNITQALREKNIQCAPVRVKALG